MSGSYSDEFTTVNGVKLHYQDWGNPDAPPLLMVHGVTSNSHTFDPTAAWLRERYHCMAIDLRGHGDSEWAEAESYNPVQYAKDIARFMDAHGIEQTHYIGNSIGGVTAMMLAVPAPERFTSLVLNDIGPNVVSGGTSRIMDAFGNLTRPFSSVENYVEEVVYKYVPRLRAVPMELVAANSRWSLREVEGGFLPKFDPHILDFVARDDASKSESQDAMWQGFKNLSCPLLTVRGEISDILSSETLEEMQQAQPSMQSVVVPGSGHHPVLIEAEAKAALEQFYA